MLPVNYLVLFLLFAVVLGAVLIFLGIIPWGSTTGYGEVLSCCSRFRAAGCENPDQVLCDGDTLRTLMDAQNLDLGQVVKACNCVLKK